MLIYDPLKYVDWFRYAKKYQELNLTVPDFSPPHKSISICTTCMNRLRDLRRTLPQNIDDNPYERAEFVVLDYGSVDGMSEWAKTFLAEHIVSGKVTYYRCESDRYRPSHARNVSFRLATGEIIVNVDADNFVGKGFLHKINQCMSLRDRRIMAVSNQFLLPNSQRLLLKGRFAMYKDDLVELGGYDEKLDEIGYSNEDLDLIMRAMMLRFNFARFPSIHVNDRIDTPKEDKIKHMASQKTISELGFMNQMAIRQKLGRHQTIVNQQKIWGAGHVIKNFSVTIPTVC